MKSVLLEGRQKMNRATSILFIVQLFGALGAGFFFVVQNVLGVEHILGALEPDNEPILWFILFWATDFFFVVFTVIFCYLFAGLPAVAPAFALSVYFAHFAGPEQAGAADTYIEYFSTPFQNGGGVNIGYMGYFIMAVVLSLLIKYLYIAWDWIKESGGPKLDNTLAKLRKKIKAIPEDLKGVTVLEALDLIVLILILPVASAAITFLVIRYGIQIPFNALGESLQSALTGLSGTSLVLTGIVIGLMVGFDLIGPVSMAAFGAAVAAFLEGDAQLITIYGACFTTIGWIPLFAVLLNKITKKGVKTDTDDMNMALSGPINAFFENMKLTVAFSMPYAYRSPLTVIPGLMAGGACTGLLVSLFKIVNTDYLTSTPIYVDGYTYAELFERGGAVYLLHPAPAQRRLAHLPHSAVLHRSVWRGSGRPGDLPAEACGLQVPDQTGHLCGTGRRHCSGNAQTGAAVCRQQKSR